MTVSHDSCWRTRQERRMWIYIYIQEVEYFRKSCNSFIKVLDNSPVDAEEDLFFCYSLGGTKGVVPIVSYVTLCIPQIFDERHYPPSSGYLRPK